MKNFMPYEYSKIINQNPYQIGNDQRRILSPGRIPHRFPFNNYERTFTPINSRIPQNYPLSMSPTKNIQFSGGKHIDMNNKLYKYNMDNIELDRFSKLHDNRLRHLEYETEQVSHQINITIKEKEQSDHQIKLLENETMQLNKIIDNKNRSFNELNDRLGMQFNEYQHNNHDKDNIFHQLEQYKTNAHLQLTSMQCDLNKKEFEQLEHNDYLHNKINDLEIDMQKEIKEWKIISAAYNEKGENELSLTHLNNNLRVSSNNKENQYQEQSLRGKIEYQQNEIWSMVKERDVNIHEKELLQNELQLAQDSIGDVNKHILSLENEIEAEKNTIYNESLRHQQVINFLTDNRNNMLTVQENLKNCLDTKISEIGKNIEDHNIFYNDNISHLNDQYNLLNNDLIKKTDIHTKLSDGMILEIEKQNSTIKQQSDNKINLEKDRKNIIDELNLQKNNFIDELEHLNCENQDQLRQKEDSVAMLSENICKIRRDIANNLDGIRSQAEERNSMANHLLSFYRPTDSNMFQRNPVYQQNNEVSLEEQFR